VPYKTTNNAENTTHGLIDSNPLLRAFHKKAKQQNSQAYTLGHLKKQITSLY